MSIRILIAEDHPVVRSGLRLLLGDQDDIQIVAEASTGLEALNLLEVTGVDLVLMDISMPDLNGLEATKQIRRLYPDLPVLVLTMHQDERYFFQTLKAGANGYIVKGAAPGDLVSAVRAVAAGQAYLYPSLASCLVKDPTASLSPREVEVLHLTAQGQTAREVSQQLCISPNTVERHRASIMSKLGLSNRSELIRYALDKGILEFG